MSANSPVFIVGVARSGTSRLYLSLQKHSRFTPTNSIDRFDLTESRIFLNAASMRQRCGNAWDFLLHDAQEHDALMRTLPSAHRSRLHDHAALQRITGYTRRTRVLWWRLCGNHTAVRSYFAHAQRARGVQRIVEKTPDHVYRMPEILATFPQARVVCTMRHPLDVFSSYKRRLTIARTVEPPDSRSVRWLEGMRPAEFIAQYRTIAALALRAHPSRMLVRYEDFTAAPQRIFAEICAFTGEAYEPNCIEDGTPGLSHWKQDPLLSQPVTVNDKPWFDYVSRDDAAHIENSLADIMALLHYDRRT